MILWFWFEIILFLVVENVNRKFSMDGLSNIVIKNISLTKGFLWIINAERVGRKKTLPFTESIYYYFKGKISSRTTKSLKVEFRDNF